MDKIKQFEEAIRERYGEDAVLTVDELQGRVDEEAFQESQKKYYEKIMKNSRESEKIKHNGVLLPKHLITKTTDRSCALCNVFSFDFRDDVYQTKYKCCRKCYIKHYEGRNK